MRYPDKAFPEGLEDRLRKACTGDAIGVMFLLNRDERVIDAVRHHADATCAEWQSVIDKRLAGYCSREGCGGDDESENEDGSYHEQHIDYAVTRRDETRRYYDRLLADIGASFKEWRGQSVVTL